MTKLQHQDRRRTLTGVAVQTGTETSINLGSALAGLAIPIVGSVTVVAVRQVVMACILVPFYRPKRSQLTWDRLRWAILLGATLVIMSLAFYEAVHLIGLGIAATIEFLGPLGLALAMSRRLLDVLCVFCAGIGIFLLGSQDGALNIWGVFLALVAAGSWAAYILLTRAVATHLPGLEGITVASIVSTVTLVPIALIVIDFSTLNWGVVGLLVAVGLLSSGIPYILDTVILRLLTAKLYSILTSIGPAIAAFFGWLILGETFSLVQAGGIGLVCVAAGVAIATQRG